MFSSILVPIDGSEHASNALRAGIEIAHKFDAEIQILTVYRGISQLDASMHMVQPESFENMGASMMEYSKSMVEDAKKICLDAGLTKVRGFIKNGPPTRTIVAFAKDHSNDLIIMGSRGMSDIDGFMIGSVSHKVTGLADCPVMVV